MEKIIDSREAILSKIKSSRPKARPMPAVPTFKIAGDTLRNFLGHLKGYDGEYKMVATREEAVKWLSQIVATKPGQTFSAIADIKGNVTLDSFKTPAEMHTIDTCVAEALMGIGETGSLLVDVKSLGNPAAALFSTDLYLLIDRKKMVAGVQEAYSKINLADYQYCAFFSGPSATADIEAVHITGAQGQISLTAVLYNCTEAETRTDAEVPASTPCAPAIKLRRESDPSKGQDSV